MLYTILRTKIGDNVGDQVILESAKNLISTIKNDLEFLVFDRNEDLTEHLGSINRTRAVIMPHFGLRDPDMHRRTYRLTKNLRDIKVPLIPLGIGWKGFPGDERTLKTLRYSRNTREFLKYVSQQVGIMACREHFTCKILERHGIDNTRMCGDPAWYDPKKIGMRLKPTHEIRKIVFTTPHMDLYHKQAKEIIKMISQKFPDAHRVCSLHAGFKSRYEKEYTDFAKICGFEIIDASSDMEKIRFYQDCDLHVGYRCHGHIIFLRNRIPSILLNEDGRGVGFSHAFGIGNFNGFLRRTNWFSGMAGRILKNELAGINVIADPNLKKRVADFIDMEQKNNFSSFQNAVRVIDRTYEDEMKPFIKSFL